MKVEHEPSKYRNNSTVDPEKFRAMVAERAYFKAQKRGFTGGHEWDDWFEAEREISNQCRYWSQG
ncbi:MAG: DUF2934 domain-containing protein [Methylococcaceae bacterium]